MAPLRRKCNGSIAVQINSFTALLFSSAVVGMNGCATVEGAGEDIQSAGEAIEEGAEDASN